MSGYYPGIYVKVNGKKKVLRGKQVYPSSQYKECCAAARAMWKEVQPDYPDCLVIDADDLKPFTFGYAIDDWSYTRDKYHTLKVQIQDKKGYREPEIVYVIPDAYADWKKANSKYRITIWKETFTVYQVNGRGEDRFSELVTFRRESDANAYARVLEKYGWVPYVRKIGDISKTQFAKITKSKNYYATGHPNEPVITRRNDRYYDDDWDDEDY